MERARMVDAGDSRAIGWLGASHPSQAAIGRMADKRSGSMVVAGIGTMAPYPPAEHASRATQVAARARTL